MNFGSLKIYGKKIIYVSSLSTHWLLLTWCLGILGVDYLQDFSLQLFLD
jgi:hypothetical protein